MRIGFLGIQCDNPNLGVEALGYSVMGIVHALTQGSADFVVFSADTPESLDRAADAMGLTSERLIAIPIRHRSLGDLRSAWRMMQTCDLIIDLTGGDSFADIYGLRRLMVNLTDKQLVLWARRPLVIAPQTIGPFRSRLILPLVRHVLNRADLIFARDEPSRDMAASLTGHEVVVATDLALALPFDRAMYTSGTTEVRVGVNVSGLLWNGGYTKDNQFGLRTDYRRYSSELIGTLCASGFEVHLIPHVIGREGALDEDDVIACKQVLVSHPRCVLAPCFDSPVAAKSYIAGMDVMIGARMHATIAAFTSGVPTIPVAYSRKFAGYYSNLGYTDLVDLTALDTATAIARTVRLVEDRQRLAEAAQYSRQIATDKLDEFTTRLAAILPTEGLGA